MRKNNGLSALFTLINAIFKFTSAAGRAYAKPVKTQAVTLDIDIGQSNRSDLFDLCSTIGYPKTDTEKAEAYDTIRRCEQLIDSSTPVVDISLFYTTKIELYYRDREKSPDYLNTAIEACRQQISYAPALAQVYLKEGMHKLPSHKGYKQLAIIWEKQKNYEKVIELCKQAKYQGWAGDWDKRIERCNKKIKPPSKK